MKKWLLKFESFLAKVRDFLDEKALHTFSRAPLSRLQRFVHFWLLVGKSFIRSRCPTHASSLAYTSLLAMVPMFFVAISISSSILKKEGGERVYEFIDKLVIQMTPAGALGNTNASPAKNVGDDASQTTLSAGTNSFNSNVNAETNVTNPSSTKNDGSTAAQVNNGREQIIDGINGFIKNIQSGRFGVTGIVVLVFMAISMLGSVESTFNNIWGITKGRGWMARIVQYWTVISLGPVLLAVALALASERRLQTTKQLLHSLPLINWLLFHFLPFVVLCLVFSLFYVLIPNTKVRWKAALVGGGVGGMLWFLNNYLSVLFVSRWATNSRIYGGLAVIPVFMVGLYLSWLILLFGAQVAHAYQNRTAYLEEKQAAAVSQRCREFIALRLMEFLGNRFQLGQPPANASELAQRLVVPACLVTQIMEPLIAAHLVVEVAGAETAYTPGKPLEKIDCHDILLALRTGSGHELETRDDPARAEVFSEFERILDAEKKAASAITVQAMVERAEKRAGAALADKPVKRLVSEKSG